LTGLAIQERRLKCKQYPKRSTTAAEIEAVHQEIEVLQAETDQAVQEYEVSDQRCAQTCLATDQGTKEQYPMFQQGRTAVLCYWDCPAQNCMQRTCLQILMS